MTSKKAREILLNSLQNIKSIFPLFFIGVVLSVLIEVYVPVVIVKNLLGSSFLITIPLATIIGIILPLPRYATYPIAFSLFNKGASLGVIFALISGEVIFGSIERDIMEFKFFGSKSFFIRLILCFLLVTAGGFWAEILLW